MKKTIFDLKKEDFPEGEPVLKSKRGLFYRDNNSGYTSNILDAGLYEKGEAIKDCFDRDGKNGNYGVFAIPLRMALEQAYFDKKKIKRYREQLAVIDCFAPVDDYNTVIF